MKHMKKVLLVLCMVACLLGMTACTGQTKDNSVDVTLAANLEQVGTQFLELFNNLSETDILSYKEQSEQQKDTVMYSALESWEGVQEDLGSFVAIDTIDVSKTDDGYMIDVNASYEKRKMTFSMGVDENVAQYISMSFNPEYSTGEKLSKAGLNTLMGMGTVFMVLILISLLIYCFNFIHKWEEAQKAKTQANVPAPVPVEAAPVEEEEEEEEEDLTDDLELVAVITAAIAAASEDDSNTVSNGLVVRSIKRVPTSKWKRA